MTPSEYLDACKAKIAVESDYELARRLEVNSGTIAEVRNGKRGVSVELGFKIAITLELDPAAVVADLESQREKNAKRKAFWTGFLQRAAVVAAIVCTLALNSGGGWSPERTAIGGAVALSAFLLLRRVRII